MNRAQHLALAVLSLLLVSACDGAGYEVAVAFDPESLADDARLVELSVVASCDDQSIGAPARDVTSSVALRRMSEPMDIGALPPGTYGLYGRATAADCSVVAAGCEPITLDAGGSGTLRVTLRATDGLGCAAGLACDDGACVSPDAGMPDGGPVDANRPDGGECETASQCDDSDACTSDDCQAGSCVYTTADADEDGHGDDACPALGGVPNDDCDDTDGAIFTGADEVCSGADNDCDGTTDEGFECALGDTEACVNCGEAGVRTCTDSCTLGACLPTAAADAVALWSFDSEPVATAYVDHAGGHDGTFTAAPTYGAGPFGCYEAAVFDGTGFGEAASSTDWDLATGTIRMWARFGLDDVEQGLISRDQSGLATPGHLTIRRLADNTVAARIQDTAGSTERCTAAPVASGQWVEIVARFGVEDFELVVEGVSADGCDVTVATQGIDGNTNPMVIGASLIVSEPGTSVNANSFYTGGLDHVQVSNRRADPASPEIAGFVLVDADLDVDLGPLGEGSVVDVAALPNVSIRVTTDPGSVGSVGIVLDGDAEFFENLQPYAFGDNAGDYDPLPLAAGEHTISATAYTESGGAGTAGPTRTIRFTVP